MIKIREIALYARIFGSLRQYVETSHMFIKTFQDIAVKRLHPLRVIILRRSWAKTLASFLELGYFSERNYHWDKWFQIPGRLTSLFSDLEVAAFSQSELICGYLYEIEHLTQEFQRTAPPGIDVVNAQLEDISEPRAVYDWLLSLGESPLPTILEVEQLQKNERRAARHLVNVKADLSDCTATVEHFLEKYADRSPTMDFSRVRI